MYHPLQQQQQPTPSICALASSSSSSSAADPHSLAPAAVRPHGNTRLGTTGSSSAQQTSCSHFPGQPLTPPRPPTMNSAVSQARSAKDRQDRVQAIFRSRMVSKDRLASLEIIPQAETYVTQALDRTPLPTLGPSLAQRQPSHSSSSYDFDSDNECATTIELDDRGNDRAKDEGWNNVFASQQQQDRHNHNQPSMPMPIERLPRHDQNHKPAKQPQARLPMQLFCQLHGSEADEEDEESEEEDHTSGDAHTPKTEFHWPPGPRGYGYHQQEKLLSDSQPTTSFRAVLGARAHVSTNFYGGAGHVPVFHGKQGKQAGNGRAHTLRSNNNDHHQKKGFGKPRFAAATYCPNPEVSAKYREPSCERNSNRGRSMIPDVSFSHFWRFCTYHPFLGY
ncbi:hypothetical protein DL93DRAFT_995891 [Clavulina sp. PMI_390]|nr:hypothetical protein DL93DRAFT_995891 [Clavulina sp. PMI_390]